MTRLHHEGTSLTEAFRERMRAIHDDVQFPVKLAVDECEETIRVLWELVGHMGVSEDATVDGYEAHLLQRARSWAESLQAAMLAAIAHAGPRLLTEIGYANDDEDEEAGGLTIR